MAFAFFRKYNKILLAVGGSILMVIFLIPQAASSLMHSPGDEVRGSIAGVNVTGNQIKTAGGEVAVLRAILGARDNELRLQFLHARDSQDINTAILTQRMVQEIDSSLQIIPDGNDAGLIWLLTQHEARQQGLYASRAESRDILARWGVSAELLSNIKRQFSIDDPFIFQALSHWQMSMRLNHLAFGQTPLSTPLGIRYTSRLSEPAVQHFACDIAPKVALDLVAVPASIMLDDIAEPSEAEIQERFNLSRNDVPGAPASAGGNQFGFGYKIPDRVKLEYIAIPLERAKQAVTIDEVEAHRYYLEHTSEFLPKTDDTLKPGDKDTANAAPGAVLSTTPRPYRDVREDIIDKLTERKALALQGQAVQLVQAAMNLAIRAWPLDPQTGYRTVPVDAAKAIDLAAIAAQVQKDTGIQPDVVRNEKDWQNINTLTSPTGFGSAYLLVGSGENRQGLPVNTYIGSTRELGQTTNLTLQQLRLQVAVPAKPVLDRDGTVYLFRVLDAQPSHAPASLDEPGIRDQVIHDVRLLKAFGSLKEQAWSFLNRAKSDGLEKLAASLGSETKIQHVSPFNRRDFNANVFSPPYAPDVDVVGQSEQFVDAVFKLAQPAAVTGKLDAIPPADRFAAVPVDAKLTVYIVQLTDYLPLSIQDYDIQHYVWVSGLSTSQFYSTVREIGSNPFDLKSLSTRVGYVPAHAEKTDEPAKPADAPKTPAPAVP